MAQLVKSDYIIKKNIPILDEHELKDRDGKVVHSVTKEKLHRIAANGNRRIRETGDYCPLVIGHTRDGQPESQQPEVVGYACNFRVGRLANTNRHAIHADFKFMKSKYDTAKNYPRRSVELWPGREEVDPISLLGATSPERDLGLIHYDRHSEPLRYSHTIEEDEMPTTPPAKPDTKDGNSAIVKEVLAALDQTDWVKFVKQAMTEQQGQEGQDGQGAVPPGPDGLPAPTGDVVPPSPTEGPSSPPPGPDGADHKDKEMYARMNDEHVRLSRAYEEQLAANTNLHYRLARVEREKDLIELEHQGVVFDLAEELDAVTPMNDTQYEQHIGRMKTRYSRAPIGGLQAFNVPAATKPQAKPATSRAEAEKVAKFARENNLTYEQAKIKLQGESVI